MAGGEKAAAHGKSVKFVERSGEDNMRFSDRRNEPGAASTRFQSLRASAFGLRSSAITNLRSSAMNLRASTMLVAHASKFSKSRRNSSGRTKGAKKPKLLCLHGYRSNEEITRMQLHHLGLSNVFQINYYGTLHGLIQSDIAADKNLQLLSKGPYYSWMNLVADWEEREDGERKFEKDGNLIMKQLMDSLKLILQHIDSIPVGKMYDAVYGFSQGGTIAAILSCPELVLKLRQEFKLKSPPTWCVMKDDEWYRRPCWKFAFLACAGDGEKIINALKRYLFLKEQKEISNENNVSHLVASSVEDSYDFRKCSTSPLASVHYIGINDILKSKSESYIGSVFQEDKALPVYLNGGHEIPVFHTDRRKDVVLVESLSWFFRLKMNTAKFDELRNVIKYRSSRDNSQVDSDDDEELRNSFEPIGNENSDIWDDKGPLEKAHIASVAKGELPFLSVYLEMRDFASRRQQLIESRRLSMDYNKGRGRGGYTRRMGSMTHTSRKSSMGFYSSGKSRRMSLSTAIDVEKQGGEDVGILEPGLHGQYMLNRIQTTYSSLIRVIQKANPRNAAIWFPGSEEPITYGDLCFFLEGDGDLRRIGTKKGDLVAYIAPPGILSAIAFITIASQCTCAPLDPAYSEKDLYQAVEQLQPKMIVVLGSVQNLADAKQVASMTETKLFVAQETEKGLFKFEDQAPFNPRQKRLICSAENVALVLRTSGSTSKPKVVPLKMHSIISNARVIAKNLGLAQDDVALNAMPLFHIGGISSNLLSSLAAGASVIVLETFNPLQFLDILTQPDPNTLSLPKPSWYSAVPTMHATLCDYAMETGQTLNNHSLRFIRSGAAALSIELAKRIEDIFEVPVVSTYSMTEQMPISQPPTGMRMIQEKPGSVGRPIAASLCIVDQNLRPVVKGKEQNTGEVCITGEPVFDGYLGNSKANMESFFLMGNMKWFRTGDVGFIDSDGFLFLTGRQKELIKRGGEQVSPYEVEDAICRHENIKVCIVFSIPDELWGQRVGAAIVLREDAKANMYGKNSSFAWSFGGKYDAFSNTTRKESIMSCSRNVDDVSSDDRSSMTSRVSKGIQKIRATLENISLHGAFSNHSAMASRKSMSEATFYEDLKKYLIEAEELQRFKLPEKIVILDEDDIPKTRSNKYIRTGLAMYLGIDKVDDSDEDIFQDLKPAEVHNASAGVRFALACAVFSNHIGDFGTWNHIRYFCLHVPAFFFLGGFHLAAGTHAPVVDDLKYFYALRLAVLHPMYVLSLLLLTLNFVLRCNPSNFDETFISDRQPVGDEKLICQATPVEMSWSTTFSLTFISNFFAVHTWPFVIPFSWFIHKYGWFSSVYLFCVFCFPWIHRYFYDRRQDISKLWKGIFVWSLLLYGYAALFNVTWPLREGDNFDANFFDLCVYLFPPGWLPCFSIGIGSYYIFAYNLPNEKGDAWKWGVLTDVLSVAFLGIYLWYGSDQRTSQPLLTDTQYEMRSHAFYVSRYICPVIFVWLYGLAVGKGITAWIMSRSIIVTYLAPASYNIYLFHQLMAEWYYLATRSEWWDYPKTYFWFSPLAIPVGVGETIIVLAITVALSIILEFRVNPILVETCTLLAERLTGKDDSDNDPSGSTLNIVKMIISDITSADVREESSLAESGLSSITTLILVTKLKKHYKLLTITARDLLRMQKVGELVDFINSALKKTAHHGGFEIGQSQNELERVGEEHENKQERRNAFIWNHPFEFAQAGSDFLQYVLEDDESDDSSSSSGSSY